MRQKNETDSKKLLMAYSMVMVILLGSFSFVGVVNSTSDAQTYADSSSDVRTYVDSTSDAQTYNQSTNVTQSKDITKVPDSLDRVLTIPQLNFELDKYVGKKVWVMGYFGDRRISGGNAGHLVTSFHMLEIDERLPKESFVRLDGDLPSKSMTSAEVMVYGEVKKYGDEYGAFTANPTPLITVENVTVLAPPGTGGVADQVIRKGEDAFPFTSSGTSISDSVATSQEGFSDTRNMDFDVETYTSPNFSTLNNGGTQASSCDRALILSGGIDDSNNHDRYAQNIKWKYDALKRLNFTDEQIEVMYNDGDKINHDGSNIVDSNVSKENINDYIDKLKNNMQPSCTLTVFVTDHGTGYNADQGYHGARPALPGTTEAENGITYPESNFSIDIRHKVYRKLTWTNPDGDTWLVYMDKEEGKLKLYKREGGEWKLKGEDANGDGNIIESETGEDIDGDGDKDNVGWGEDDLGDKKHANNTWDTDGDGIEDVRVRWNGSEYVFERNDSGTWKKMGNDTDGNYIINESDGGIDWNTDGDTEDKVGFHEGINLWGDEVLWDDEFGNMMKELEEAGIHVVVEMAQCFSGGMIPNVKGDVEKIVTFSGENTKHWNREADDGSYFAADEKAFVENLEGIDVESWNKAFEKAKKADEKEWREDGAEPKKKNEHSVWERPEIESNSSLNTTNASSLPPGYYIYNVTIDLPESYKGKVHGFEFIFGLQQPRRRFEIYKLPPSFSVKRIPGGISMWTEEPLTTSPINMKFIGHKGNTELRFDLLNKSFERFGYVVASQADRETRVLRAIAGLGGDSLIVEFEELQKAISLWATGQTINGDKVTFSDIQKAIQHWVKGEPVP